MIANLLNTQNLGILFGISEMSLNGESMFSFRPVDDSSQSHATTTKYPGSDKSSIESNFKMLAAFK